jgi:hypothetical protein
MSTTAASSELCDPGQVVTIASVALATARLSEPDADWEAPTIDGAFVERTTDAQRFALALGLDCSWSATQSFANVERLAIAAWTGDRLSMAVQATDSPSVPFGEDRTVDVLVDAPKGEMVADDTWAATLPEGETIILLTRNTQNLGVTAKSWLADFVFVPEDVGGETATEQMAILALQAAGGRNVHVGEDSHGSPISVLSLVSRLGDTLFVTVGPADRFDPSGYLPLGEFFDETVHETLVGLVDPADEFPASAAAFNCNGFGWAVEANTGEVAETREFLVGLIEALDCGKGHPSATSPPVLSDATVVEAGALITSFIEALKHDQLDAAQRLAWGASPDSVMDREFDRFLGEFSWIPDITGFRFVVVPSFAFTEAMPVVTVIEDDTQPRAASFVLSTPRLAKPLTIALLPSKRITVHPPGGSTVHPGDTITFYARPVEGSARAFLDTNELDVHIDDNLGTISVLLPDDLPTNVVITLSVATPELPEAAAAAYRVAPEG